MLGSGEDHIRLILSPISGADTNKIRQVFVEPVGYSKFFEERVLKRTNCRIIIISGPAACGKLACSIKLGLDLQDQVNAKLIFCSYQHDPRHRLDDLVSSDQFHANSFCIVENAFKNGVNPAELCFPNLNPIYEHLAEKNAYLILTTCQEDLPEQEVELSFSISYPDKKEAHQEFIEKVFWQHFHYFCQSLTNIFPEKFLEEALFGQTPVAFQLFSSPSKIDRFFNTLLKMDTTHEIKKQIDIDNIKNSRSARFEVIDEDQKKEFLKKATIEMAGRAVQSSSMELESPRSWFNGLSENERLFVMLARLFENIDRLTLNDLYIEAVDYLRKKDIASLCNPRELGFDDLLERIYGFEENGIIQFQDVGILKEVDWQIKNRHPLLWLLMEVFEANIQDKKGPEYWNIRRAYGIAIARLARSHPQRLEQALYRLVQHRSGGVRVVAAYALSELCSQGEDFFPLVQKILVDWVESGDPDNLWATSACVRWVDDTVLARKQQKSLQANEVQYLDEFLEVMWEILRLTAIQIKNSKSQSKRKGLIEVLGEKVYEQIAHNKKLSDITLAVKKNVDQKVQEWEEQNLKSLFFTINRVAEIDPAGTVDHLLIWIKDSNQDVSITGLFAAFFLIHDPELQKKEFFTPHHGPMLRLIEPMLREFPLAAVYILRDIYLWIKNKTTPEILNLYYTNLSQAIVGLSSNRRALMKNVLADVWFDQDAAAASDVDQLGAYLIRLICILEGSPVFPRESGWIALGIDDSAQGRLNGIPLYAEKYFPILNGRLDTYAFLMGRSRVFGTPNKMYHAPVPTPQPHPCLFTTPVEQTILSSRLPIRLGVGLTFNPISDLVDFECFGRYQDVILVQPDKLPSNQPSSKSNLINAKLADHWTNYISNVRFNADGHMDWDVFDESVDRILSRQLAELPEGEMAAYLKPEIDNVALDAAAGCALLQNWVQSGSLEPYQKQLENLSAATWLASWLFKSNPDALINELQGWLEDKEEGSRLPVFGAAISHLLLQQAICSHTEIEQKAWSERYARILPLLVPFAHHSNGVTRGKRVLSFIWACVTANKAQITQREIILEFKVDNDVFKYACNYVELMKALAKDDLQVYITQIQGWLDQKKRSPREIIVFLERIQTLLKISAGSGLPELKEGQRYGVILLQATRPENYSGEDFSEWDGIKLINDIVYKWPNEEPFINCVPVILRFGQSLPITIDHDGTSIDINSQTPRTSLPALSAPLMDQFEPESTAFILFLNDTPVLDLDDWLDGRWSSKIPILWHSMKEGMEPQSNHLSKVIIDKDQSEIFSIFETIYRSVMKGDNE